MKYIFTRPFWLVSILDMCMCVVEVDFGMRFSNQIESMRFKDSLKLGFRVFCGMIRWMIGG